MESRQFRFKLACYEWESGLRSHRRWSPTIREYPRDGSFVIGVALPPELLEILETAVTFVSHSVDAYTFEASRGTGETSNGRFSDSPSIELLFAIRSGD